MHNDEGTNRERTERGEKEYEREREREKSGRGLGYLAAVKMRGNAQAALRKSLIHLTFYLNRRITRASDGVMFARGRDNNRGRDYATVHTDRRKNVRVRSLEGTAMRSVEKNAVMKKGSFAPSD